MVPGTGGQSNCAAGDDEESVGGLVGDDAVDAAVHVSEAAAERVA